MKELNKSKKSKKKLFVTLGLLFGLAGIGTAAFAGYVIADHTVTSPADQTPGEVVITTDSYKVTGTIQNNEKLYFYPEEDVKGEKLSYEVNPETPANLDLTVVVTTSGALTGKAIKVTVSDATADGTQSAVEKHYIDLPNPAEQTSNYEDSTNSYNFTFAFKWGSYWGGSNANPCDYFNTGDGNSLPAGTSADTIDDNTINGIMNDFNTALRNTTIKFAITIEDATA